MRLLAATAIMAAALQTADASGVIVVDVAVIGGGSSGTFGAITLKDLGQSVVVIEQSDRLGGHFDAYVDPGSNQTIEYGIQGLWNTSVVRDFFARFGVPLENFAIPSNPPTYLDFSTGLPVTGIPFPPDYSNYAAQVNTYPELEYGNSIPTPVPADFSLTFDAFVKKYSLQDEAYNIYTSIGGTGLYNIAKLAAYTVMHSFNQIDFASLNGETVVGDYKTLFAEAQAELGSSAMLNTRVISAQRAATGVQLTVQTSCGTKIIQAKKLLMTAPQILPNMQPLGLDLQEEAVFAQFNYNGVYAGLVNNTGFPPFATFTNAQQNTEYNIPAGPNVAHFFPTSVQGTYSFWYYAPGAVSAADVSSAVTAAVANLTHNPLADPQVVALASHTPYNLNVAPNAIAAGFYQQLNALQGHRNTWYTGGAFSVSSGPLWVFTQSLITKLVTS